MQMLIWNTTDIAWEQNAEEIVWLRETVIIKGMEKII
jgi:hypothetical protein